MKTVFTRSFNPPAPFANNRWLLEVLTPDCVEEDYAVVMANRHRLRSVFTEHDQWPADSMTLSDNLADLQMHQREYQMREAYAYVVYSLSKEYVGCVYLYPPSVVGFDAELFYWVDERFVSNEPSLQCDILQWLKHDWGLLNVALPGREHPWSTWKGKLFHSPN